MPKLTRCIAPLLALLTILLPASAYSSHDDLKIAQILNELEANRKLLVAENMALDESATKFWKLYAAYRSEIAALETQDIKLLTEFHEHFAELNDERATIMLKKYFELQKKKIIVQEGYVDKFSTTLTPRQALRFYQIENKLDAIIQADISSTTPLAD